MNIFEEGSPFQQFLNKVADLLILNLITLLTCLPIITIGASLTAMHYVLLKTVRGQEGHVVRSYFRSFRRNFVQATILWLIYLAVWILMVSNLYMIVQGTGRYPIWLPSSILVAALLILVFMIYTFAMLSRFETTVFEALTNAVMLTISELPRSLEMLIITVVPIAAFFFAPILLPILILFGLSVPGYACAMVYDPVFRKIERQIGEGEAEYPDDEEEE